VGATGWDASATAYAAKWKYYDGGRIESLVKGAAGAPTTSTYTYTDTAHPAAVTQVTNGTTTDSFGYDTAGRMVSRTVNNVPTALTWDVTSSLVESNGQGGHVVYAYDASGQRVVQATLARPGGGVHGEDLSGTATAYVASGQVDDPDTASTSTGDLSATRYYTFAGSTVAVRTNDGQLSLMLGDEQGSTNVMMPVHVVADANGTSAHLAPATLADATAVTRTSYTPYGQLRGADNLATDRGWLGQVEDRVSADGTTGTGLTYLNARYYDPATSRFISPDPLMNPSDPKTLDPYRYADNNPVVFTDATGLAACSGLSAANEKTCMGAYNTGMGYAQPKWDLSPKALRNAELHGLKGVGKGLVNLVLGATPIPGLVTSYTQGKAYFKDPAGTRNASFANTKSHWDQYFESGMRWDDWVMGKGSFGDAWHATTHSWMAAHIGQNWDRKDLNAIMETGGEGGTYLTAAIAGPEIMGGLGAEGVTAEVADSAVAGTNASGQLTSRTSFRDSTVEGVWDGAETGPTGGRMCSSGCGTELKVPPRSGLARDWDMSHNPSWSNRLFSTDTPRSGVIDNYNEGVGLECQACNRGGGNNDARFAPAS